MTGSVVDATAPTNTAPADIVEAWLSRFVEAINARDGDAVRELFVPQGGWRDLVAVTWDWQTAVGHEALTSFVERTVTTATVHSARLIDLIPPTVDTSGAAPTIEAGFEFATDGTVSRGLVRLVQGVDSNWAAFTVYTELHDLVGLPGNETSWEDMGNARWNEPIENNRNWADSRDPNRPFPTSAPTVLVAGAGQAGLQVAAHLQRLGIDTVVVERNDRIGDSWRKRHYNLITHTPTFTDQFSYLPFPKSWPMSMPKDKLANWIENYAEALDLHVWTSTEVVSAQPQGDGQGWDVTVRRADGGTETLHPTHFVFAAGLYGPPVTIDLPHRDDFTGTVMHALEYVSGTKEWNGKRAVVVGSGSTAHDLAQDLVEQGCTDVTMVQRSSTYVLSYKRSTRMAYEGTYGPAGGRDAGGEELVRADMRYKGTPMPILLDLTEAFTEAVAEIDGDLQRGLEAAGFRTNQVGMLRLALSPGLSGYYINQGASDLIIEGRIKVKNGEVTDLDETGIVFADGSRLDADLVVLSTGYRNAKYNLLSILDEEAVEALPDAWVLDHETRGGDHGLLWGETGHPNLWYAAGGIHQSRLYSPSLALKIAAIEQGLVTQVGGRS